MTGAKRIYIVQSICFTVFLIAFGSGFAWAQNSDAVEVDPSYVSANPVHPPVQNFRPLLTTTPPPQTVVAPMPDVPLAPPPVAQETVPVEPVAVGNASPPAEPVIIEETTPPAILGKAFAPREEDRGLEDSERESGSTPEPENKIVSFPVQVKTTSESLDPNVESGSAPIVPPPAPTVEAEPIKDFGAMVKDAATALEEVPEPQAQSATETKIVEEKKAKEKPVVASDVPIPKRRPKFEKKIAKTKDKAPLPAAPAKIRNMNLADAPHKVDLDDDHLSQSIADIDVNDLAAAIDAIDAGRAPKKPPQKAGSAQIRRIEAKPFGHKKKAEKVKAGEAEDRGLANRGLEDRKEEERLVKSGETLTLAFAPAAEKMDKAALEQMKTEILPILRQEKSARALIVAYAAPVEGGDISSARRLSLARAVAVRSYLLDKGIEPSRIDVRAQGMSESGAPDRVDVTFLNLASAVREARTQ